MHILSLRAVQEDLKSVSKKVVLRLWPLVSKSVVPASIGHFFSQIYASALMTALNLCVHSNWVSQIQVSDFLYMDAQQMLSSMTQCLIQYVPTGPFLKEIQFASDTIY